MPRKRVLVPNSVWDADAVASAFEAAGAKPGVHLMRMYSHLLRHPGATWHDVPDLPKAAVAALDAGFSMFTTRLAATQPSAGGDTVKLLVALQDGLRVESVIMDYGARSTLCVSSEVGCQMGCTFCATGTMGLTADLTAGEIVEQLVHACRVKPIRNVVFMGMGEPLNNYTAVKAAVLMFTHPQAFALRRQSVTVSTVGVIPRLASLAADLPGVSLALSLHAPTQELRAKIVPSARAYRLDRLMAAVDAYQAATGQRVFIEYVLLGPGVNCLAEHARELGELLRGRDVVVNLIPWNPILSPGMDFAAPAEGAAAEFHRVLKEEFELPTTLRQEKGQDVAAACGQLVLEHGGRCGSGDGGGVADLEDLAPRPQATLSAKG